MARSNLTRIPIPSTNIQHFVASIIFVIFLPLLPLFLELLLLSKVSAQSLTLGAAIYALSIGASSTEVIIFALAVPVSVIFSAVFGSILSTTSPPQGLSYGAALSILAIAIIHAVERWNRHAVEGERFLTFRDGTVLQSEEKAF